MKEVIILLYVVLSICLVNFANRLWLAKALPRLQDIQVQIVLLVFWAMFSGFRANLMIGWVCFVAAFGYKFWIDFRLWHRAKTGAMYPCLVAETKEKLKGKLITTLSVIPVEIVQTLNDEKPEANETYWCRVLKASLWSARVEVELLDKMNWGESVQYFASHKEKSKKFNLANFINLFKK